MRDWQIAYFASLQSMSLYITSDVNTSGTVEIPGLGYTQNYTVVANNITVVNIPDGAKLRTAGLHKTGIHVTAEKPVVVYSHIFASNVSGATLVLPTPTLGKDYYSINYKQVSNEVNSYSYFFVVAVEDNTQVEITPSANTLNGWAANSTNIISLNKGEIFQVLGVGTGSEQVGEERNGFPVYKFTGVDLTGSRIRSVSTTSEPCKRIAVFSGSGKIGIGCENFNSRDGYGSSDNLYQQVYPTTAWGKKFITVPLESRNYDIIRVIKSDPATQVTVNGTLINNNQFVNNFYYEFPTTRTNVIEADKPIQAVQYSVTQNKTLGCNYIEEPAGDPEMIYLNSIEQNIDNITVYSTSQYRILNHFINVVIESDAVAGFRIDGRNPGGFSAVPGQPGYSYAQLRVNTGVHTLTAPKGFNAIAYGFGEAESYGYSAGVNVNNLGIQAESRITNTLTNTGCVDEPLKLKINLVYQTTKLVWDVGDSSPVREDLSPQLKETIVVDGKTFYVYELEGPVTYTEAKDYTIEVTADKTSADGCGNSEELYLDFSVYEPPVAGFAFTPAEACAGNTVTFTDQSNGKNRNITSWLWDFGDGITATEQNPAHTFAGPGVYTVSLTVTNESNCYPSATKQTVTIVKQPEAKFSSSALACINQPVTFTDQSVTVQGTIIKWLWDFGNGITSEEQNPVNNYTDTGSYVVKLVVETDKGCTAEWSQNLIINPSPVVNFGMPEYCVNDVEAIFTDSSSVPDQTETSFTYLWNFDDASANSQRPNTSTDKNGSHVYTRPGTYQVSLTVKSGSGCAITTTKSFTVNGSVPEAGFAVLNEGQLCSDQEVVFEDQATIDYGEITKIEWYFDADNAVADVVDEEPADRNEAARQYRFLYPAFHSPLTKTIRVRMKVFSGNTCFEEILKTITLKAVPNLVFEALPDICMDGTPFQVNTAKEISNFPGKGTFSGQGITETGFFDPKVAGAGTHVLTYMFIGNNGCQASVTQTINVFPVPPMSAGEDLTVLEGGSTVLKAAAEGTNFVYKWSPSTGLDRNDVLNPVASPLSDITYTLTVTSAEGCIATDEVFVKILKEPVIPNTFTPNDDGVNDVWNIKYLDTYTDAVIEIFTRYGVKVYETIGYTVPWNGKVTGADLPMGTYYYVIDPKNGQKVLSGSVTILR